MNEILRLTKCGRVCIYTHNCFFFYIRLAGLKLVYTYVYVYMHKMKFLEP